VFVEIGPDGTLSALGPAALGERDGVFVPVLRPGQPAVAAVLAALARLHVRGVAADWGTLLGPGRRVELPTYAFQHQRYWPQAVTAGRPARDEASGPAAAAEARFWAVVESGDPQALADLVKVDGRRPFGEVLPALASWRHQEQDRSLTGGWRYRISWAPVTEPAPAALPGTWLIVAPAGPDPDGLTARCERALAARGAQPVVIQAPAGADRAALAAQLSQASETAAAAGVLSLLAFSEGPAARFPALPEGLAQTMTLTQALGDAAIGAPLWVLTSGAVAAGTGDALTRPVQAQVWGLGRVAALEHPDRWGGLVDLPPALDERAAARLCAVLAGCGEDQVAIRGAGILARRLARASQPRADRTWQPPGSVLVTGGTGALGGHAARWLAGRGAPRVVLASRSGPAAPGAAALAARLAAAGTGTEVVAADVADRGQAAGLLARTTAAGPPLTAVLHAAGLGQDTPLADSTVAELAAMTAAKAAGAAHLDELTRDLPLERFVLFSSIAATWGSGLQPGYAAANAFLDGLAEHRRAQGHPATSVAWGPWDGGGMTDREGAAQLQRRGLTPMDPNLAIQALSQVLDSGETQVTVAAVDWTRFAPPFTLRRPSPLIEQLPEVRQALAEAAAGEEAGLAGDGRTLGPQLAGLPPAEQERLLVQLIRAEAAAVLGYSSAGAMEDLGADRAFRELGFDSLTAVELRNRLSEVSGQRLPATLIFDYPTPADLAAYLRAGESQHQDTPDQLAAELDRLESILSQATPDEATRDLVAGRLQEFLANWSDPAGQQERQSVAQKIDAATDDEIFSFIHSELGRS
jgi:NAD(P)-dependent dehydrogenase (short-subunit alcohol dehydrogenase family)/acyl carrier protein